MASFFIINKLFSQNQTETMHKQIKRIAIKITCYHDAILLSRIFDNLLKVVKKRLIFI